MIHATVIGNLGKNAELRHTQGGKSVLNFSVASRGRSKEDPPTWVRGALWGARGEKVSQYLTKGTRVAISGALTTREHNGKTYLELDVQELELLGSPGENQPAPQQRQQQQRSRQSNPHVDDMADNYEPDPNDYDLPF